MRRALFLNDTVFVIIFSGIWITIWICQSRSINVDQSISIFMSGSVNLDLYMRICQYGSVNLDLLFWICISGSVNLNQSVNLDLVCCRVLCTRARTTTAARLCTSPPVRAGWTWCASCCVTEHWYTAGIATASPRFMTPSRLTSTRSSSC